MSARERASGRTTRAKSRPEGAAGGKTTDSDNLTATAKPGPTATRSTPHSSEAAAVWLPRRRTAATKSSAAAPRRGGPRRAGPTPPPKRTDATGVLASDTARRRRPDSARAQVITAKSAARKRSQEERSRASAHSRSTSPNRTRRPDSSSSERRGPTDAPRGQVSRSDEPDVESLKTHVYRLLDAVLDRGVVLTRKIQEWMDTLVEAVEHGGAGMKAGLEGIRAVLTGRNPVWAAIKGLVSGLSGTAKVALVLLVVLGLVLAPVLLVVLLLALLVAALVAAVRAAAE
jgi:hypothetical protein